MNERRLLQSVVSICVAVPIVGGAAGVLYGPAMVGPTFANATGFADSHFRYLSGLLLAIGLGFLSTVPNIERCTHRFRLLAAIVFAGGLGRLLSLASVGTPDASTVFAAVMELVVTPALVLWQWRVSLAPAKQG